MTFQWAFPSHATRPVRPYCAGCAAWHGSEVVRVKGRSTWMPVGSVSFDASVFETKPERIDLSESELCARCRSMR